ncbi:sulfate transporter 2.1-like [Pyrus ussuriensis x Pyrus communis]|uniref:Sulfate transporter 2.1-like n=1 Tax=Pyrus ussuriensis x Pyrus communis TaxID=2448454 RepID=A0A5N5GRS6_9ROSA|nr:sulfate transporter 2.1-like [Pyrus ussuriensis x Pyrus communis]
MDSIKDIVSCCRKKYLSFKNQPTLKSVVSIFTNLARIDFEIIIELTKTTTIASLIKLQDPGGDPIAYTKLVLTATFFTGIFQAAFGLFRVFDCTGLDYAELGFLVDFLSHAPIVGFVGRAAIIIGLQQLKALLGITHFPINTDIKSVMEAWRPHDFIIGCSFLCFILISRFLGNKRKKTLFWLPTVAPLLSVILSTLIVYLTRGDKHGIKIVKHIKDGLNPSSMNLLQMNSPHVGDVAKVGLIVALVALTEAIAVRRYFSSMKGYHIDGNKEMISMGFMNIVGSCTSCYVAAGSFSSTAVNFSASCETPVSNVVMAITVIISLQFLTKLLYYTLTAILASIILSALPGLINLSEVYKIWKVDRLDFLACIGAFFGVLFASVEIGLLVAVTISFTKIIIISIRSGRETLGKLPGTEKFCNIAQYPIAVKTLGVIIIRVKSTMFCFANANLVRERIVRWITAKKGEDTKGHTKEPIQLVILDMSSKWLNEKKIRDNVASHSQIKAVQLWGKNWRKGLRDGRRSSGREIQ